MIRRFGWVTAGTAEQKTKLRSEGAVVAVLAPICVDKFRHAAGAPENLSSRSSPRECRRVRQAGKSARSAADDRLREPTRGLGDRPSKSGVTVPVVETRPACLRRRGRFVHGIRRQSLFPTRLCLQGWFRRTSILYLWCSLNDDHSKMCSSDICSDATLPAKLRRNGPRFARASACARQLDLVP